MSKGYNATVTKTEDYDEKQIIAEFAGTIAESNSLLYLEMIKDSDTIDMTIVESAMAEMSAALSKLSLTLDHVVDAERVRTLRQELLNK